MAKPKPFEPDQPRRLPVDLDPSLNLDLWSYCSATHRTNHSEVVRLALVEFLDRAMRSDDLSRDIADARRRLLGEETIRLLPKDDSDRGRREGS